MVLEVITNNNVFDIETDSVSIDEIEQALDSNSTIVIEDTDNNIHYLNTINIIDLIVMKSIKDIAPIEKK